MAHTKQTGRRPRYTMNSPPPPPRLSETPEEDWFVEESERKAYFPQFVAAALSTVSIEDNLNDEGQGTFYFGVSFMVRTYKFTLDRMAEAWGLRNEGTTFRRGSNPHGSWNEFVKMDAARALRLEPTAAGKYHVSKMTTDHRLLLYVLSYVLMPRKSNHGTATEEDLIILWAMINEK
ncbi:hypothetical protein PIB30_028610 [Stylosanthes scabra]|uniref:Uncharacterized protein n=1 Tax=Stylosanthes scabra TaxID=79078 RepID=A0ABU6Y8B1_9FABA|nr:hypothetical protein [Stylosanthes scabra]